MNVLPQGKSHILSHIKWLPLLQVQLYIGNLSPDWQEDLAFVNAMSEYGSLERAYVMRNSAGLSKVTRLPCFSFLQLQTLPKSLCPDLYPPKSDRILDMHNL